MQDRVFESFLNQQYIEGASLAAASDLIELYPSSGALSQQYLIRLNCNGLIREPGGAVAPWSDFQVGVWFPSDYLRRADPFEVLTWLGPREVFHPNISDQAPFICVGRLTPGTPLVDLVYQCFEIVTYQKVTMREDDAMNHAACVWARQNQARFPIDRRPLKRRTLDLDLQTTRMAE